LGWGKIETMKEQISSTFGFMNKHGHKASDVFMAILQRTVSVLSENETDIALKQEQLNRAARDMNPRQRMSLYVSSIMNICQTKHII
jgi:hypothetical protein